MIFSTTSLLTAIFMAVFTLTTTSTTAQAALGANLISERAFQEQTPIESYSWGAAMMFPGYYDAPDYDYLLTEVLTFDPIDEETAEATVVDSADMDLTPLLHDSTEIWFRVITVINLNVNGNFRMTVDDTQSNRYVELSGSLSGSIVRGQDIYIHSYADFMPKGQITSYAYSIKDGNNAPLEPGFGIRARATSDGDLDELTTLHIHGWTGSELEITFWSGNVVRGDLDEFRLHEIDILATVPEPGSALLALIGGCAIMIRRRR